MNEEESVLMQKSQAFATRIATMTEYLTNNRCKVFASLYDQVLRSGTSVMANVSESQFAQSSADFITKLHIALKEASETRSWLKLLYHKSVITEREYESMRADCSEIVALLVASLNTAKKNSKKTKNNDEE
jgi:four helix bundle protein